MKAPFSWVAASREEHPGPPLSKVSDRLVGFLRDLSILQPNTQGIRSTNLRAREILVEDAT